MRRIWLIHRVAIPLVAAVLGAVGTSAEASAAVTTPGPPTGVLATFRAGVPGATISWTPPVSDGGSPILYYTASTYSGSNSCVSFQPGPKTCHVAGVRIGKVKPSIRVRAVSATGRGAVTVVLPVVVQTATGNAPPTAPSGTGLAGIGLTTSSPPAVGTGGVPTATSSASAPSELPFTGTDIEALLVVGVSLLSAGLLILSPVRWRRRAYQ